MNANEAVTENRTELSTVPRDPGDYYADDHFLVRFRADCGPASETRTNPKITGEVIETCIRQGEVEAERNDCISYTADVGPTTWVLIADPVEGAVVTAYSPAHHDVSYTWGGSE